VEIVEIVFKNLIYLVSSNLSKWKKIFICWTIYYSFWQWRL